MNSEEKRAERIEYARVIGNVISQNRPVIYVDETTFRGQSVQKKSWSTRNDHNFHYMTGPHFGTTVYGAVGDCIKNKFVYRLEPKSTNEVDYLKFLKENLLPAIQGGGPRNKPICIFDQHKAHLTDEVMKKLSHYVIPLPQVSYSSNFNSIETLWQLTKQRYYKRRLLDQDQLSKADFLERVQAALNDIKPATIKSVLNANRAYIRHYLMAGNQSAAEG